MKRNKSLAFRSFFLTSIGFLLLASSCKKKDSTDFLTEIIEEGYELDPQEFHRAIEQGNLDVAKRFLEAGFLVSTLSQQEELPLITAIQHRQAQIVDLLLSYNADPNSISKEGVPALHLATALAETTIIKSLLSKNADPLQSSSKNNSLLSEAVLSNQKKGDLETVKLLVDLLPDQINRAFLIACITGNIDIVDFLYSKGADIFYQTKDKSSPLIFAARYGNLDVVTYLLHRGADPYALDKDGINGATYAEDLLKKLRNGEAEAQQLSTVELQEKVNELETLITLLNYPTGEEIGLESGLTQDSRAAWESGAQGLELVSIEGETLVGVTQEFPTIATDENENENGNGSTLEETSLSQNSLTENNEQPEEGAPTSHDPNLLPQNPKETEIEDSSNSSDFVASTPNQTEEQPAQEATITPQASPRLNGLFLEEYHSMSLPLVFEGYNSTEDQARIQLFVAGNQQVDLTPGQMIPNTRLQLVEVAQRVITDSKDQGELDSYTQTEARIRDVNSGEEIVLLEGQQPPAREPWALLRTENNNYYQARAGDQFFLEDERWEVMELRNGQVLLRSLETTEVILLQR